jgi:hypothetical protein
MRAPPNSDPDREYMDGHLCFEILSKYDTGILETQDPSARVPLTALFE